MLVKDHNEKEIYITPRAKYTARKDQTFTDRMDTFTILDGSVWIDQMLLFANSRKAEGMRESYTLDAIANEELGTEKLDYSGYTIKNLAWKNFRRFILYNMLDTVLLDQLETKNLDVEMLQKLSEITNTRKYKVFKKTVSLKNYMAKFAELQGYRLSCNKNAKYGEDGEYFEKNYLNKKEVQESDPKYLDLLTKKENFGAYVARPELNENCGIKINGRISKYLYENVFDEDFSSLYPSIIRSENQETSTLVGKFFLIDDHIKNKLISDYGYSGMFVLSKNDEANADSDSESSDIGPILSDSILSQNWARIGEKYFDLPSAESLIEEIKKENK